MNTLIKNIAETILLENTVFQNFILDARKDEEGRVTIPIEINGNERTFGGITDANGCFFYFRWREDFIFYEEMNGDKRFASCENFVEQRSPFRLVAVVDHEVDPFALEAGIRQTLLRWKMNPSSGIKNGRTILRQSLVDSIEVLKEETKSPKKFDKNLTFVLIDFDLSIEISATCDSKILIL